MRGWFARIFARHQLRIALALAGAALAASTAHAQMPAARGPRWHAGPPWAARSAAKPHPAVARIVVPEGGATSYGSGTLVDVREQYGLVITNWHVVRDSRGTIEVVFPGGFTSLARAIKLDKNWDLAALVIWRPPVEPVAIAQQAPRRGDVLSIAGYGQGRYRLASGRCTQYLAPAVNFPQELVELSVEARQGDSGGPILNQRGELAGVLFGASRGTTLGSYAGRVEQFLAGVVPAESDAPLPNAMLAAASTQTVPKKEGRPSAAKVDEIAEPAPLRPLVPVSPPPAQLAEATEPLSPAVDHESAPELDPSWPAVRPFRQTLDNGVQLVSELPRREPAGDSSLAVEQAPLTASISAAPSPPPRSVTWRDLAGESYFEQAKTILAGIGFFAILFLLLRNR